MTAEPRPQVLWVCAEWSNAHTHTGGVGRHAYRLACEVAPLVDLTVLTFVGADRPEGVTVIEIDRPRGRFARFYLAPFAFRRVVARLPHHVVHGYGDDWALPRGRLAVRSFLGSARSEARASTGVRKANHYVLHVLEKISQRRARYRIAIAPESAAVFDCHTVMPPIARLPVRLSPRKTETPTAVFIGAFTGRKRGAVAQQMVRGAEQALGAPVRLVVIGPADDASSWDEQVTHVAGASDAEVAERVASAWVLLAPSLYEGFGIPTAEALALGTAVIASPNPGNEYMLTLARRELPLCVVDDAHLTEALTRRLAAGPHLSAREASAAADFAAALTAAADVAQLVQVYRGARVG